MPKGLRAACATGASVPETSARPSKARSAEFTPGQIKVAGIVGLKERHTGRALAAHRVLGSPEELGDILNSLEVHGVTVNLIAVAAPFRTFSPCAQEALLAAERTRAIELRFLAEDWGLVAGKSTGALSQERTTLNGDPEVRFEVSKTVLDRIAVRSYWFLKRSLDFLGAIVLTLLLSPLMAMVAMLVTVSIGFPVLFWQQRPGLGGRTFRLYKFRTMRSAHSHDGSRLSDSERVSTIGNLLRHLRLDELPQLFNIMRGDMSFIGPRPLLEQDQSKAYSARRLVRPGLTGWAQVVGGRNLSSVDKAALDVWYVCNASLALDAEIVLRTVPFVLFGERITLRHLEHAWQQLRERGMVKDSSFLSSHN